MGRVNLQVKSPVSTVKYQCRTKRQRPRRSDVRVLDHEKGFEDVGKVITPRKTGVLRGQRRSRQGDNTLQDMTGNGGFSLIRSIANPGKCSKVTRESLAFEG